MNKDIEVLKSRIIKWEDLNPLVKDYLENNQKHLETFENKIIEETKKLKIQKL